MRTRHNREFECASPRHIDRSLSRTATSVAASDGGGDREREGGCHALGWGGGDAERGKKRGKEEEEEGKGKCEGSCVWLMVHEDLVCRMVSQVRH
jgi:hypothetical protein